MGADQRSVPKVSGDYRRCGLYVLRPVVSRTLRRPDAGVHGFDSCPVGENCLFSESKMIKTVCGDVYTTSTTCPHKSVPAKEKSWDRSLCRKHPGQKKNECRKKMKLGIIFLQFYFSFCIPRRDWCPAGIFPDGFGKSSDGAHDSRNSGRNVSDFKRDSILKDR